MANPNPSITGKITIAVQLQENGQYVCQLSPALSDRSSDSIRCYGQSKEHAEARKEWKFRLTRSLYEQGYERRDILNLFRFIDWLMVLPEELKQAFQLDLALLEQE